NGALYKDNGASVMNGRRVDLLVTCQGIELTTNEWKRHTTSRVIAQQHCKNARFNKAILKSILSRAPLSNATTLAMDWAGTVGHMFSLRNHDDLYVVTHEADLSIPDYIAELPGFLETIQHLFTWVEHNVKLKDTILAARFLARKRRTMRGLSSNEPLDVESQNWHHDTFFSPRKRRCTSKNIETNQNEGTDETGSEFEEQAASVYLNSPTYNRSA
ncbi:hypothetical protein BC940DRAFT_232898, partial [Gongronella butleri]